MSEHAAVPGVGTCTGEGCSHGRRPDHRPHPKFACACGNWYSTARGLKSHVTKAQYWVPVEEMRALAEQAGYTMTLELPDGWPRDQHRWASHVPET